MLDEGKLETFRGHTVVMLFVIKARLVLLGYQVAANHSALILPIHIQ